MLTRTGIYLADECLFSIFISVNKLLDEADIPAPSNFTLSTGKVTGVIIHGTLIELKTTNFYGSDSPNITVSFNGSRVQSADGERLSPFSNVSVTNRISSHLLEYPTIKFPTSFPGVINVTDADSAQAGNNALVGGDPAEAGNNTVKLQALIAANSDMQPGGAFPPYGRRPLYIPDGVYYFNGRLENTADLTLYGQSENTILRWVDNSPGFNATDKRECCLAIGWRQKDATGFGFNNYIFNITLDLGNNPEAIGFGWYGNNGGGAYNIHIRGNGFAGVAVRTGAFPSSAMWFYVEGCRYGIVVGSGSAFYQVSLKNQTEAGIYAGDPIEVANPFMLDIDGTRSYVGGDTGTGGVGAAFYNLISEQRANVPVLKTFFNDLYQSIQIGFANCSFYSDGADFALDFMYQQRKWLEVYNAYQSGYAAFLWDQMNECVVGFDHIPRYSCENADLASERPIQGGTDIFPNFPKFRLPEPATSTWRSLEDYPPGIGIQQGDNTNHARAIAAAFADPSVDVLWIPPSQYSNDQSGYYIDPNNYPAEIKGDRGGKDLFVIGCGQNFDMADSAMNDTDNASLFTIGDIGGGRVWLVALNMSLTTRGNFFKNCLLHDSDSDLILLNSGFGFTTIGGPPFSQTKYGYNVADNRKPNVFLGGTLLAKNRFANGQYAVITNANWNNGGVTAVDRSIPAVRVEGGAKALIVNRRTENTRVSSTGSSTEIDGTGSYLYELTSWIDQHSTDPFTTNGPMVAVTNGGMYLGTLSEHDNNPQFFPKKYARDGDVLIQKAEGYLPQSLNLSNTGVYISTASSFSAGGSGAMPPPRIIRNGAVVGDPKGVFGNNKIFIAFDIPLAGFIPAVTAFSITVNGSARAVLRASISGVRHGNWHSHICTLTLASAVAPGDVVFASYTEPGSNKLQSKQGIPVPSFMQPVVNLVS